MDTYEKKYKEAQKWIESIYSELSHEQQMEAEAFFPELKESEDVDKKIREEIIATIHLYYGKQLEDEAKEMIAWLEKQGEQKPADKVEPKFKVGDVMRTLQEAANNITSGLPVVVSIDKEYYHCTNELIAIKDQDDYEYPPMNRAIAWSEEDEKKFSDILAILRGGENCYYNSPILIDWLKSLKTRITWKPSEMQIQCLYDAIEHYQTNGYPASKLNELYEQMSKIYKL